VNRENSFDAFALDKAANSEHLAYTTILSGDDIALENLNSFLLTIEDLLVNFNAVADSKVGDITF
jgi:hypothetical protein